MRQQRFDFGSGAAAPVTSPDRLVLLPDGRSIPLSVVVLIWELERRTGALGIDAIDRATAAERDQLDRVFEACSALVLFESGAYHDARRA